ncbi:DUF1524 domain-containing protein [Pseudarthrobacter sp. NPDC092424]|uniref:GmrSD restriction endonuclease domain-containing protein n=1 Tax=Pseudarthrobacter sp. NPDC092424 TaxID=3364415 RepID=UPI0037FD46C9
MSTYRGLRGLSVLAAAFLVALLAAGCGAPAVTEKLDGPTAGSTAAAATAEARESAGGVVAPSSVPTPKETAAPLDPPTAAAVAGARAPKPQPAFAAKALGLLATLPVKGRAPKTGYDRAQFGQAWADVDRNGCDTRNDMLRRDLTAIRYANSVPCKVKSGVLADPYTGTSISFLRGAGTSSKVQIDHVVALSDAWQKGAQMLTLQQRTAFANDPLNLQATDGRTNQQKGDGDAATWLPPNKGFRCQYVARQISVKATYSLWVTQAEHDAMARVLGSCAGQSAPAKSKSPGAVAPPPAAPAPAPVAPAPVAPAPVAPAAPAPVAVYYPNCSAARAAGAAPLYAGMAGYRAGLDRDRDGVACE